MKHKSSSASGPTFARQLFIWLLLLVIVAAIAWWLWPVPPAPTPLAAPTSEEKVAGPADYTPLVGRWARTDGEYMIEIRSVAPDGKMEAKYFNPGPINVGKAMAMVDAGRLTALVELRDVNYPGSTYRLRHAGDKLTGEYFQATQGETFPVEFVRVPDSAP